MGTIKIIKGEATAEEIAAIEKALSQRQSQLINNSNYGKTEIIRD
jgi:hypothetical protein